MTLPAPEQGLRPLVCASRDFEAILSFVPPFQDQSLEQDLSHEQVLGMVSVLESHDTL